MKRIMICVIMLAILVASAVLFTSCKNIGSKEPLNTKVRVTTAAPKPDALLVFNKNDAEFGWDEWVRYPQDTGNTDEETPNTDIPTTDADAETSETEY